MPIPQIKPDQAKKILDEDVNALYLDVRSVPEFTQGHAAGAINIPLLHAQGGQMASNPDFARVVEGVISKEKRLVVGCQRGGRSQKACEILTELGYKNVSNIDGGFGGNERQQGWKALGLPVSTENGDGVGYESLASKSKGS